MASVYIGLGSNLGHREGYLRSAIEALCDLSQGRIEATSSIYETPPVGVTDQPDFLNAVVKVETPLSPREVLSICQRIEEHLGRIRTRRWGPRTIDLDLLLYEDRVVHEEDLILPHPRMAERIFVLVPLLEIEPCWIHPIEQRTGKELLRRISVEYPIRKVGALNLPEGAIRTSPLRVPLV